MKWNSRHALVVGLAMAAIVSACAAGTAGTTVVPADPGETTTTTPAIPPPTIGPETSVIAHQTLVDESGIGGVFTTAAADDADELASLWERLGIDGAPPPVDFAEEVVLYFGVGESGSCPYLGLSRVVYAEPDIRVYPTMQDSVPAGTACTADARPHAVVVAVNRADLPDAEFHLWVVADDFSSREGVTFIAPGELRPRSGSDYPALGADGSLDVGETRIAYGVNTHCGVEWLLRPVNEMTWRAVDLDETDASGIDPVPSAWGQANDDIDLELTLVDESTLEVTALGTDVTVTYTPDPDPPGCD